jgi:hypothetical protein
VAGLGRIFCDGKTYRAGISRIKIGLDIRSVVFLADTWFDLRFYFTYTPRMERGRTIHFLPRNSRTKIISVSPLFSRDFTSHSQLGRESIALAFLDKTTSSDNTDNLGNH